MSKEEMMVFGGTVTEKLPNAMFRVKLENEHEIIAHTADFRQALVATPLRHVCAFVHLGSRPGFVGARSPRPRSEWSTWPR